MLYKVLTAITTHQPALNNYHGNSHAILHVSLVDAPDEETAIEKVTPGLLKDEKVFAVDVLRLEEGPVYMGQFLAYLTRLEFENAIDFHNSPAPAPAQAAPEA